MDIPSVDDLRKAKLQEFTDEINEKIKNARINNDGKYCFDFDIYPEDTWLAGEIIGSLENKGFNCEVDRGCYRRFEYKEGLWVYVTWSY